VVLQLTMAGLAFSHSSVLEHLVAPPMSQQMVLFASTLDSPEQSLSVAQLDITGSLAAETTAAVEQVSIP